MEWHKLTVETIIVAKFPDGSRYLKQFLIDYSALTNAQNLCANCDNAIAEYHKKYTTKIMEKSNDCQYRLLEKYNGILLEPNSSTFVNNGNITDEYGEILFKNRGARIFSKLPTQETIVEPTDAQKPKGTRKKRR